LLTVALALVTVWLGIVLSYRTNWPLGFFVGATGTIFFLLGRGWRLVKNLRWHRLESTA
jgi:zinc/manganese transport system permease protein